MSSTEYIYSTDHASDINPLRAPSLVWGYVKPYLEKYNVEFTEWAPELPIDKPVICWRVIYRRPGERKQPQYAGYGSRGDGTSEVRDLVFYNMEIQYKIYAKSSSVLDDLAWDFEFAVLQAEQPIQAQYAGFHIEFARQEVDQSENERKSELETRDLRFKFTVPVNFKRVFRELRNVKIQLWGNDLAYLDVETTYSGDLITEFDLPTYRNVKSIHSIKRNIGGVDITLDPGTDYAVKRNATGRIYIEWNEFGSVPDVGETFWISYVVNSVINTVERI